MKLLCGEDPCTREQLAQMLYSYAKLCGYDLTKTEGASSGYADSGKISTWAHNCMDWAISQGIMSGKGRADAEKSAKQLEP